MDKADIKKGLEHEAQKITERIPDIMADHAINQVRQALHGFISAYGFSQRQIAEKVGVSSAQINQFLKGKYRGNLDDLVNKIINVINDIDRQEGHKRRQPFVNTTIARQIGTLVTNTIAFSQSESKIGLVIGDGGHGKSLCLKAYAEANKNAVYCELDDTMTSKIMFTEIAKELSRKRYKIEPAGTISVICERLIAVLRNRHVVILLDEASGLTIKQLNQLRQILVVKARCPLILAGNAHLLKTIMQPAESQGKESLDQFTSRLMAVLDLDEKAADRNGGLYTAEDIRKLYQYGGLRLTSPAVKTLQKFCRCSRGGRLRTCSHIIEALHTSPEIKGVIDAEHIYQALEELGLPVAIWLPAYGKEAGAEVDEEAAAAAG